MEITINLTPAQVAAIREQFRIQGADPRESQFSNYVIQQATDFFDNIRDRYPMDRITVGEFTGRNPVGYARIMAERGNDPLIEQFATRLHAEQYVWLGSTEVQQAIGYLLQKLGTDGQPVLSAEQAQQLLDYAVPTLLPEPTPEQPE